MRPSRGAFTIVEALVIITILVILIALLVPAVQRVRESAARAQCANNLKKLALGMNGYETSHKAFPSGVGKFGCCWGTWLVLLLPHIDHGPLYEGYKNWGGNTVTGADYASPPNLDVTGTRLPVFTCPTDFASAPNGIVNINYVVNYGNTTFFQADILVGGVVTRFGGAPFNCYFGSTGDDGPINADEAAKWNRRYGKAVKIAEIPDGLSNTLLMSEVIQGQGIDHRGAAYWGGGSGFVTFIRPNSSEPDIMYGGACNLADPRNPPCMTCAAPPPSALGRRQAARSRHNGGVNAAMGDGTVRFIANAIDINIWRALGTAHGSEPVSLD
jgi:prepilin-type processing-associated H-X9-DG protein